MNCQLSGTHSLELHVRVVVPIFEVHFVEMWVGMGLIAVNVIMLDVFMLVAGMRVGMAHRAVVVLMIMRCHVLVRPCHLIASSLVGSGSVDVNGDIPGRCRWSFPERWSICRRASSSKAAT